MPDPSCVVLLSGGLDSTASGELAHREGGVAVALTVDYGQRAAAAEIGAAAASARRWGAEHQVLRLALWGGGAGALVGDGELPELAADDLEAVDGRLERTAAAVWVPNRNGVLVQCAAAVAEERGLGRVVVGFNREEAATFPDNGPGFLAACNAALAFSTRTRVRVEAPTLEMDKREIGELARSLGLRREMLWSCYREGPSPCGRCESCRRLDRALPPLPSR